MTTETTPPTENAKASDQPIAHSPGPWGIAVWAEHHKLAGQASGIHQEDENGDNLEDICEMDQWTEAAERMANARLIAAAPNLLESLIEVTQELEACGDSYDTSIADYAWSVIRRATGESA